MVFLGIYAVGTLLLMPVVWRLQRRESWCLLNLNGFRSAASARPSTPFRLILSPRERLALGRLMDSAGWLIPSALELRAPNRRLACAESRTRPKEVPGCLHEKPSHPPAEEMTEVSDVSSQEVRRLRCDSGAKDWFILFGEPCGGRQPCTGSFHDNLDCRQQLLQAVAAVRSVEITPGLLRRVTRRQEPDVGPPPNLE